MLNGIAKATSRVMQALIPSGASMYSSADMPSTAPWADYWYQSMGLPGLQGIVGGDEAYEYVSAFYAATRLLSSIGSKMPLNRKRCVDTAIGETSSVMRNDPVHRLLNYEANSDQTSMVFRAMMVSWQVNRGTAFAEIQRDPRTKRPVALWPIHPSRCKWFRDPETQELWWYVRNNQGFDTEIPDRDMLRIPYTILDKSGIRGVGVADRAGMTIQLSQSLDRTENDATMSGVPRIVVEAKHKMTIPEQDSFRRQWRELYTQGGEGVALLVGDMQAKPLSWSAVDSDHVERRKFNSEDVARWYDVPPVLLRMAVAGGDIEQLGQMFQTYSLGFLEIWEQELARKLLTEEDRDDGQYWEIEYKSLLKANHPARAAYNAAMVPIGALNPNEVRKEEGKNPYEGGEKYFVQGALRPIDEPYGATSPQNPPQDPKAGKADPLKIPKQPKHQKIKASALKTGARTMLEDCLRRLTNRETIAACKASHKPSEWNKWIDTFYAKHETIASTELSKPLEVCKVFGVSLTPKEMATSMANEAKQSWLDAADGPADEFSARVETLASKWETERASLIVKSIPELN